jgi:adenylate cyclase
MGIEIERKFLVKGDGWRSHIRSRHQLRQGYLSGTGAVTVRVRTIDDEKGFITIKGGGSALARSEFEYEIPVVDARSLLKMASGAVLAKRRNILDLGPGEWIVDEFEGRHKGLVMAEIELERPDTALDLPGWIGIEVTSDPQFYNYSLAMLPGSGEI